VSKHQDKPAIVWDEIQKRFKAYLNIEGQRSLLGSFQSVEDAAMARTQAAWLYVEQFANIP
jgi:hypothetical protein